ncbi:MAG: hypothetical protein NTW21_28075 [Verrucomicrobia bacterium]|nr:hypothetical protein [Verrucomicrobiota bacterium]
MRIARTAAEKFQTRLVFEIHNGRAGLRYYSYVKNIDSAKTLTISASDILALNFPNNPHNLHYVPPNTVWSSTTGVLADGKRTCLVRYDTGDGWAINPENHFRTSLRPGIHSSGEGTSPIRPRSPSRPGNLRILSLQSIALTGTRWTFACYGRMTR